MSDISEFTARELVLRWEDMAVYDEDPANQMRRATLRECADVIRMLAWVGDDRIGTHGPDCWKWGPRHYQCARRLLEETLDPETGANLG